MAKKTNKWQKTVNPFYSGVALVAMLTLFLATGMVMTKNATVNQVGSVAGANANGFDEFGYNRRARIFVGKADGIDKNLDSKVWGSTDYANDHLVMKWNAEWDRGNLEGWSQPPYEAWEDNEWNGMMPDGSRETWHYKIVWDQGCKVNNTPSTKSVKGEVQCVWGQFAIVMSQGTFDGEHVWETLGAPSGYGANKN